MSSVSPTLRPVIAPARRGGLQVLLLCVLSLLPAGAKSPLQADTALLGGGPGTGSGDRPSQEIANLISRTDGIDVADALPREPNAQELA